MVRGSVLDGGKTFRGPDLAGRAVEAGVPTLEIRLDLFVDEDHVAEVVLVLEGRTQGADQDAE